MKKKLLYAGLAGVFALTTIGGVVISKKWVDQRIEDRVSEYEKKDKKWTGDEILRYEEKDKKWTGDEILRYEEKDKKWTIDKFQEEVNQEQLMEAYNSTYLVINQFFFKTQSGQMVPNTATGTGILLNGGYLLTAKHVADADTSQFKNMMHPFFGPVTYSHNKLSISKQGLGKSEELYDLEKIVSGEKEGLDYTLLKVKKEDLPYYSKGLNLPDKVKIGMRTIAIGYPLGIGKNARIGNISQLDSDMGEVHITYKNSIYQSDSGGPLFGVEDGEVKLLAISRAIIQDPQTGAPYNINYGVKISNIIADMESQLESGKLDEKTAQEVKNFLELNKK